MITTEQVDTPDGRWWRAVYTSPSSEEEERCTAYAKTEPEARERVMFLRGIKLGLSLAAKRAESIKVE